MSWQALDFGAETGVAFENARDFAEKSVFSRDSSLSIFTAAGRNSGRLHSCPGSGAFVLALASRLVEFVLVTAPKFLSDV